MVNHVYRKFREKAWSGAVALAADTFECLLVMTDSTASADLDAEFVGDIATLDELDATGYSRVTLAGLTLTEDLVADLYRWSCSDVDFGSPNPDATRQVRAAIIYQLVTDDADSPVALYIDTVAASPIFPFTVNGGPVLLTPPAEGLITV